MALPSTPDQDQGRPGIFGGNPSAGQPPQPGAQPPAAAGDGDPTHNLIQSIFGKVGQGDMGKFLEALGMNGVFHNDGVHSINDGQGRPVWPKAGPQIPSILQRNPVKPQPQPFRFGPGAAAPNTPAGIPGLGSPLRQP